MIKRGSMVERYTEEQSESLRNKKLPLLKPVIAMEPYTAGTTLSKMKGNGEAVEFHTNMLRAQLELGATENRQRIMAKFEGPGQILGNLDESVSSLVEKKRMKA